jgi:hypothetical protein
VNPVVAGMIAVFFGVCILILPGFIAAYVVRRFGGSANQGKANGAGGLACPRCESPGLERLAPNRITPFPGYRCRECDFHMRPFGTTAFYVVVLVLCLGLLSGFLLATNEGANLDLHILYVIGVVGIYSAYQLIRPTPLRSSVDPAGPEDDAAGD